MKLTSIQFYFSVIKQEEEVNNNTKETLQILLRRYTTKRKLTKIKKKDWKKVQDVRYQRERKHKDNR